MPPSSSQGLAPGAFQFGFVQICRPFDTNRATYRQRGALARQGKDLDVKVSMEVRSVQPVQDHPDVFAGPPVPGSAGKAVPVKFFDTPAHHFPATLLRNGNTFEITGLHWESLFFLALCVQVPSGGVLPLETLFWDLKHREALPTPASRLTAGPDVSQQHGDGQSCVLCARCRENEPEFKHGPVGTDCNAATRPTANVFARDAQGKLPAVPGDFTI